MSHISWNCRGLGKPCTVRALGDLIRDHKPIFVFLSETISFANKIEDLRVKFGFDYCFAVDRVGRSGGLAVLWKQIANCQVAGYSNHHIDMLFMENSTVSWRLSCYYGYPERTRRRESWSLIRRLADISNVPWCIWGDFNDLLFASDKKGTIAHPQYLLDGFRKVIEECQLDEINLRGGKFTWERGRGTNAWVREKLDRGFANAGWLAKFPANNLKVVHAPVSDHEPIVLDLLSTEISKKEWRFRFENIWLKEPDFVKEVSEIWEEIYWKQRAKLFWLREGDDNTRFFHASASAKKKANKIAFLTNDAGERVEDHDGMSEIVREYFSKLFTEEEGINNMTMPDSHRMLSAEQNRKLTEEFTFDEFTTALKQMHPDKAGGPDGLNPAFFQSFWKVMGHEVFKQCTQWIKRKEFQGNLNSTNVALIPKKEHASNMRDLRPIALCNVLYRIMANVLANRLQEVLPSLISENQSAFIKNRGITDNVLIAFEVIHHMSRKKKGRVGEVALKLDISKAYDKVNWSFLQRRMKAMGFCDKWIE
ncbi:uncharacterized protein LOC141686552 [Apium graveolens]|uniref:uncharacterized protein LOC141686552 n=1 Tax=Apium graveolens TaxID=4045 RepID=UPI003D796F9F